MDGVWVSVGRSRETGTGAGVQAIEHSQQSEGKSVGSGGSGTHRPRRRFRAPPRPCPRPPRSWHPRQTWPQPRAWSLLRKTSCPRAGRCDGGGARSSFFCDEKTRDAGEKRRLFPVFLQTVCSLRHFRRCCALIGRAGDQVFFPNTQSPGLNHVTSTPATPATQPASASSGAPHRPREIFDPAPPHT